MIHLGNLQVNEGATKKRKRIGRGPGSGHGGTSTKGHKGQLSRRGASIPRYFEGGQMPINRRLPKFGFFNRFRVDYQVINVGDIQKMIDDKKLESEKINPEILFKAGVLSKKSKPVKILGDGLLKIPVNIVAHSFSNSAKQKIESAGGTVTIHG